MAETKSTSSPIDNIRRDGKDGAYHCPQCDTPFTRRSNLRRHFQIHMRSAILKCENCGIEYITREELQNHTLSCYSNLAWNHSSHKPFRMMERPFVKPDPSSSPDLLIMPSRISSGNFLDGSTYATSAGLFPSFDSPDPRFPGNYTASDFGQAMSPLSSSGSVASTNTALSSYDGNFASPSCHPNLFSHRRPSTSSSMSSSSTSSSPYVNALKHPQGTCYGCYTCTGVQADTSPPTWHGVPASPVIQAMEEPVYTRRQVKDMIDVVSDCLIETMENVLTRSPSGGLNSDSSNGHLIRSIRDDGFRQTVLSEAIPRVYYRIQAGSNSLGR